MTDMPDSGKDPFGDHGDPFAETDGETGDEQKKTGGSRGGGRRGGKRKLPPARKTAFAAISAALAVVMITIAAWLPVTAAPLLLVSVSWNLAAEKCGIGYGIASVLASVALGFLCSAANVAVLVLVAVVFVPYSLLCTLLSRLHVGYGRVPTAVIRVLSVAAFGALEVFIVYNIAGALAGVNEYVDIGSIISFIAGGNFAAGYIGVTVAAAVIFVLVDVVYCYFFRKVLDKIQ